jgi:predicted component of type VI protein secretion system
VVVFICASLRKATSREPDLNENPPRLPIVLPTFTLEMVSESNYREFSNHPYAIPVGKVGVNGSDIKIEDDYIPPCFSIMAHPDLLSLHAEMDKFFADIELYCSKIVQKIYVKKQQNEISELVMFLCDRVILYLGQAITTMRWRMINEPPIELFMSIACLARL